MINHFLDLHTEHTPSERCNELGNALANNREFFTPYPPCPFKLPAIASET